MNIEFLNNLHWFWFALTVIFTLIEIFTVGLTTIWFALGSLAMIFISFSKIGFWWQVLLCLVISTLLLVLTRPILIKKLKIGSAKTNTEALIGEKCKVIKKITELEKGEVKIHGNIWSAKSLNKSSIEEGSLVIIKGIEGATLIVENI